MHKYFSYIFLAVFVFISNLKAESSYGDNFSKKIETKHFVILYNEKITKIAGFLADNIEEWAEEVFDFYGATPQVKVYIFLGNYTDASNASSFGNSISLDINTTIDNDFYLSWIEDTFKHELAHSMNILYDYNPWVTYLFSTYFRILSPLWLEEGMGVMTETKLPSQISTGRGANEEFLSQIRYKYNENVSKYFYYDGKHQYQDGWTFFDFFEKRYGAYNHKKARKAYMGNAFNRVVFSPVTVYAREVGISVDDLYKEYDKYMEQEYAIDNTKAYKEGELLFRDNFNTDNRIIQILEIDSDNIYYYGYIKSKVTGNTDVGVYAYNLKSKDHSSFVFINQNATSVYKKGKDIYYTALYETNYLGNSYSKAYRYNEDKVLFATDRLDGGRVLSIVPTNDGLYYVVGNQDSQSIIDSKNNKTIISFDKGMTFGILFFDEKRNSIFFEAGVKNKGGRPYIYEYNIDYKTLKKLTEGRQPSVKNDMLYYSDTKNNQRYNIYSLNLKTNQIVQLTDTKYGAFNPLYSNGVLYYLSYYGKNKSIYSIAEKDFVNMQVGSTAKGNETIDVYTLDHLENEIDKMDSSSLNFINSKDIAIWDYKLEEINIFPGSAKFAFQSLSRTNSFNIGVEQVDYSDYQRDGKDNALSYKLGFVYNPRNSLQDLFAVNLSYANKKNYLVEAGLNPILYDGYANIPTLILNTKYNSKEDYTLGGTLLFKQSNIIFEGGYTTQYSREEALAYYSVGIKGILSAVFYQGKGATYNLKVTKEQSSKLDWKVQGLDNVAQIALERNFNFDIYQGKKDGRFGLDTVTIKPSLVHFYGFNNKLMKESITQSSFANLEILFRATAFYGFPITFGVDLSYRYNYDNKYNNNYFADNNKGFKFGYLVDIDL